MNDEQGEDNRSIDSKCAHGFVPSPNWGERLECNRPDLVILHYTGMQSEQGALDWLCSEQSQVSCHYVVFEDGKIVQLVKEDKRAWHAGKSCWQGNVDINSRSFGIEITNPGHEHGYRPFTPPQMLAVCDLVQDIAVRWGIPPKGIVGHADVAPLRKEDPGELFDWHLLCQRQLAICVDVNPPDNVWIDETDQTKVRSLQNSLQAIGYGVECNGTYDSLTQACVTAFQRRFRPLRVDGRVDQSTLEAILRVEEHL